MYGYAWFVAVATMTCLTTTYADALDRPTQRASEASYGYPDDRAFPRQDRQDVGVGYRPNGRYNNVNPVRHTHTSTRVDLPGNEDFRNGPTTVRDYVRKDTKNNFDAADAPDLAARSSNKRKSQDNLYRAYADEAKMVYPSDDDQPAANVSFVLRSRSCFDGLCDEVDNYPTEKIHKILSSSKELKQFFSTKITEVIVTTPPAVDSRFGENGKPMVEQLCPTTTHTRFPKSAMNMNNIEQLLVNVDNFKQGIVYETCTSNGACKFVEGFPQDYITSCTQKYTVRKLMVVGKESDNPVFDDFKIPSCCVCTVTTQTGGKT